MATQANRQPTTKLSDLISDPFVRDAFRRAERGQGGAMTVPAPSPSRPPMPAGAVAEPAR